MQPAADIGRTVVGTPVALIGGCEHVWPVTKQLPELEASNWSQQGSDSLPPVRSMNQSHQRKNEAAPAREIGDDIFRQH